jgi:primosomal protein N' (replication factor Y) (superfamily II helicase)
MTQYIEVAVNVPQVSSAFHYHLPPELEGLVSTGSLVTVPFGAQTVQGVVLGLIDSPQVPETRPVLGLADPQPVLNGSQIQLARWLAENTLAPLAVCLDAMVPPGMSQHTDLLVHLGPAAAAAGESPVVFPEGEGSSTPAVKGRRAKVSLQEHILALLRERGDLRGRQIEAAFPRQNWRAALSAMQRRGLVGVESLLSKPAVRPKTARTVQLAVSPEAVETRRGELGRAGSAPAARRQAALNFLLQEPWPVDISWVYAQSGANSADLQKLAELGLVAFGEEEIWRDPLERVETELSGPLALTPDQKKALEAVLTGLDSAFRGESVLPFLLHGVTSSGKTEIYLQAVAETLRRGRQAIVMVPEISLTPQTIRRFLSRFPGQVGVVHSRLSPGERFDTWRRARAGLLPVIIGPRSALFSPLSSLGLIVADECHDESYYQDENLPYYHAVTAAAAYARICGGVALMGSATPEITQMYQAESGAWRKLSLPLRLDAHREAVAQQAAARGGLPPASSPVESPTANLELPPVSVVDMRRELKDGNRSIFSRELQAGLQEVLAAGQQAILFLNRRGTASYVFCRDCGQSLHCPRCDRPLTFHDPQSALVCHACGYRRQMPKTCPHCSSTQIRQMGTGTERVEEEVKTLFPQARTLRWDAETTRQKGAHDVILSHFAEHRADVLVGTQMLAKGLDLPLVTLVGAILAEVALNLPDYRAGERTFQVLTQVAGRAGRSSLGGRVIFQTFQPEHYAIQAAAGHDYASFYQQELALRRRLRYPPFSRLVRLEYRHTQARTAETAAGNLAGQIRAWLLSEDRRATDLVGPVPCFFARQNGFYRWQIILRGPDPASLLSGRSLADWHVEVDPLSLL